MTTRDPVSHLSHALRWDRVPALGRLIHVRRWDDNLMVFAASSLWHLIEKQFSGLNRCTTHCILGRS